MEGGDCPGLDAGDHHAAERLKGFVDVDVVTGAGLQELELVLVGECLTLLLGDHTLNRADITFVGNEHFGYMILVLFVDLSDPFTDVVEAAAVRH